MFSLSYLFHCLDLSHQATLYALLTRSPKYLAKCLKQCAWTLQTPSRMVVKSRNSKIVFPVIQSFITTQQYNFGQVSYYLCISLPHL